AARQPRHGRSHSRAPWSGQADPRRVRRHALSVRRPDRHERRERGTAGPAARPRDHAEAPGGAGPAGGSAAGRSSARSHLPPFAAGLAVAAPGSRPLPERQAGGRGSVPLRPADRLLHSLLPAVQSPGGRGAVPTMSEHAFSLDERAAVYRAIAERRDMRHFSGGEVGPELLARLLEAAHQAPSVGLMQPWRFIRVTSTGLRESIHALVEAERIRTAEALGERSDEFMRLKVEGIRDCAELLVAALMDGREAHVFGRRTLPQMDLASLACALQKLWLAARAEGLGMGR